MFKFLFVFLLSTRVFASTTQLNIGIGPSLNKSSIPQLLSLPTTVSRSNRGEFIQITFKSQKYISSIKLVGYSNSRLGKVLIRDASVGLEGLTNFSKVTSSDRAENYQNLVMLADRSFVEVEPKQSFLSLGLVVEGFANNDASLLLQITSTDDLSTKDFLVTRSSTNSESVGNYFDENNFKHLTVSQLRSLMKISKTPSIDEIAGKAFVCSRYPTNPNESPIFDMVTRQYFVSPPGVLNSSSDLTSQSFIWTRSELGWTIGIMYDQVDCGKLNHRSFIRLTPEGNVIGEWTVELNEFVNACVKKGFNATASRESILSWSKPSLISPDKLIASGYDLCRQIKF